MKTIEQKIEEVRNEIRNGTRHHPFSENYVFISVYIPFKKESKSWYAKKILEQDKAKWFVEYDDVEKHFFSFFREGKKPDYDGVYYVSFMDEQGTYNSNHPENRYVSADRIRRHYLMEKYSNEFKTESGWEKPVTFNVRCTMKRRWADEFASFLKRLEDNGNIGHSSEISFYADGDGDFRPKFEIDDKSIVNDLQPIVLDRDDRAAECMFDAG